MKITMCSHFVSHVESATICGEYVCLYVIFRDLLKPAEVAEEASCSEEPAIHSVEVQHVSGMCVWVCVRCEYVCVCVCVRCVSVRCVCMYVCGCVV